MSVSKGQQRVEKVSGPAGKQEKRLEISKGGSSIEGLRGRRSHPFGKPFFFKIGPLKGPEGKKDCRGKRGKTSQEKGSSNVSK